MDPVLKITIIAALLWLLSMLARAEYSAREYVLKSSIVERIAV